MRFKHIGIDLNRNMRNEINENFTVANNEFDKQDKLIKDVDKDHKKRIDDLITGVEQPSEVVDARGNFPILRDRLDNVNEQLAQTMIEIEDIAVSVKKFGAKGDGVTDDTQAFLSALQQSESIFLPYGEYVVNELLLPQKNCFIYTNRATVKGTSGTFIFKQRKRGYLTKFDGITFTGNATSFFYESDESLPNHTQQYEFFISRCRFLQTGVHSIILYGAREGVIDNCYFQGNKGVLTEFAINTVVSNCQFKHCEHMVRSKLGSEGLVVSNGVALGCVYGILGERTTGVQIINSMIDYCDIPVFLKGATDVLINNNYISTRTENAAIRTIQFDDGFMGYRYVISNNILRTNSAEGERVVLLEDIYEGVFSQNNLNHYKGNGLEYGNLLHFNISDNTIRPRSGQGVNSITPTAKGDHDSVNIQFNNVNKPINRTSARLFRNRGFSTENSGEAIITSGNSNVVVNHGLAIVPSKNNIMLTPTTPNTRDLNYFVDNITATTFRINVGNAVVGTTAFAWKI